MALATLSCRKGRGGRGREVRGCRRQKLTVLCYVIKASSVTGHNETGTSGYYVGRRGMEDGIWVLLEERRKEGREEEKEWCEDKFFPPLSFNIFSSFLLISFLILFFMFLNTMPVGKALNRGGDWRLKQICALGNLIPLFWAPGLILPI